MQSQETFTLKFTQPIDCGADPTEPSTITTKHSLKSLERKIKEIFSSKLEKFDPCFDFTLICPLIVNKMKSVIITDTYYDDDDIRIILTSKIENTITSTKINQREEMKIGDFIESVMNDASNVEEEEELSDEELRKFRMLKSL